MRLHLDDGIFSCFGCGAKGDVVEWVRQTEGVDWRGAIDILDDRRPLTNAWASQARSADERPHPTPGRHAGVLAAGSQAEAPDLARTSPERIHEALAAAWGYYSYPPLRYRAEDYLKGRGIDVRALEAHTGRTEVGHTPAKADGLVIALRSKGFSDDELVDAGLAHRYLGGGPLSDFYRQRVLIPVRDDQSRIAGFIGRNVGDQQRFAKYKNSPRTPVYDKSVNLYQPLPAPAHPRGQVIVVEGTLDAIAIAVSAIRTGQADQYCPVTQSGRELSPAQLNQVIGLHPTALILGFDGDRAGQEAAYRHALAAARQGRTLWVTVLPGDHDPASWLAEQGDDGLKAWARHKARVVGRPAPVPVDAATYMAGYVARKALGRADRTNAIVAAAEACRGLPGNSAQLWASRMDQFRTDPSTTRIPVSKFTVSADWVVDL